VECESHGENDEFIDSWVLSINFLSLALRFRLVSLPLLLGRVSCSTLSTLSKITTSSRVLTFSLFKPTILNLTSILSHHFYQVLMTMLKDPKQVPKEPQVDTVQKYNLGKCEGGKEIAKKYNG